VKYTVVTKTDNEITSATWANIYVVIVGTKGRTRPLKLHGDGRAWPDPSYYVEL
jgi:hypothetical protein